MKLTNEKIEYLAKQIYEGSIKRLQEINTVEPGDTLELNYEIQLITCIDKQDVI